jgi:NACalpha-BTF3-like transcription factor
MINGNEILALMCRPMHDENLLNIMEQLGMKVPELDGKYEIEEKVVSRSNDEVIVFEFREISGLSKDGEPNLTLVSFQKSNLLSLPFNLNYSDGYKECCEKIGKEADKQSKIRKTVKYWYLEINNQEVVISVNFSSDFNEIKFMNIVFEVND